ncbi:MAG: amino acid ABC transporter permease [Victivallales bacterium]|nr:amino acid ABC transporter permease [Victivallales bacterium]
MTLNLILLKLSRGLVTSVNIFFLTLLFTFPFGLLVALVRMHKNPILSNIARIYISIMRGTPLMLQLLIVYFGPYYLFGWSLKNYPPFVAVIIAFVLNYSAYFAEIYRSGIASIPIGQYEAATVLGYSKQQTFFKIILPQVIKRIVPPITNEIITLVKDTSLAQVISVLEMFTIAKQIANAQSSMLALVIAGVFYYVFNFLVAVVMERIEKKLDYYR